MNRSSNATTVQCLGFLVFVFRLARIASVTFMIKYLSLPKHAFRLSLNAMKPIMFVFCILMSGLTSCQYTLPAPDDLLTHATWCDGYRTYQFKADGSFRMTNPQTEKVWSGSWFYRNASTRTELEIDLRFGPNNQIQIIQLKAIDCLSTKLSASWTDEIAHEIPVAWQACAVNQ